MVTVLYVDTQGRDDARAPIWSGNLRMQRARTVAEAKTILDARADSLDAVLFCWEPKEGIEPIEEILAAAGAAGLEVVAVVPRRAAMRAEEAIGVGAFWVVTVPCDALHLRRVLKAAVDTVELRRGIASIDRDWETILDLLEGGVFRFRTPREARVLAERLGSKCPEPQASVALLELMVNAVEHGNLGITYKEKGALLADGLFEREVESRLEDPEYRDRFATLEVSRRETCLELLINDAGPGFDWSPYLAMDDDRVLDSHGRGLLLASATLSIEFLEPGNRVKVVLPLPDPDAAPQAAGKTKGQRAPALPLRDPGAR